MTWCWTHSIFSWNIYISFSSRVVFILGNKDLPARGKHEIMPCPGVKIEFFSFYGGAVHRETKTTQKHELKYLHIYTLLLISLLPQIVLYSISIESEILFFLLISQKKIFQPSQSLSFSIIIQITFIPLAGTLH